MDSPILAKLDAIIKYKDNKVLIKLNQKWKRFYLKIELILRTKKIESYKLSCKYYTTTPKEEIRLKSDSDYNIIVSNRFETRLEERED